MHNSNLYFIIVFKFGNPNNYQMIFLQKNLINLNNLKNYIYYFLIIFIIINFFIKFLILKYLKSIYTIQNINQNFIIIYLTLIMNHFILIMSIKNYVKLYLVILNII